MDISIAGMFGNSSRRDAGFVRSFAQTVEELGFRALYLPEHVVFFPSYDSKYPYTPDGAPNWGPDTGIYDPLFVAMAAGAVTTRLRFVTGVLILPQRPALLTAKEVMTLDHFVDGRFELGIGSGWSWEEYGALGVPFERRGRRLDEYIAAIRAAWTDDRATFKGETVEFTDAVLNPKPLTPGGPPIIVGGDSPAAMRRAARLGDGWYGWWAQPDLEAHLDQLRSILADHDRAVDDFGDGDGRGFSLRVGWPMDGSWPDQIADRVATAERLGVDELVLAAPVATRDADATLAQLASAAGIG